MIIRGIAISRQSSAVSKGIAISKEAVGSQKKVETPSSLLTAALADSH